jgi:putative FmdB family regulatory protein
MPTYIYEAARGEKGCPACQAGFEVSHGMNEPAPAECPRCGGRIRRRLTAPGIITRFNEKSTLSDSNLKRHGFKKLVNEGDGKFKVTL